MLKDATLPDGLTLHPSAAKDGALMEALFRSTREHFYSMPLSREHIDLLIAQQYQLQQASYARQWPDARTMIIERRGKSIGKIMLDEAETAVHIVDFIIEPGMRGLGYGTAVLQALQAAAGRRRIKLSVDRQNLPAKKFYCSLGFQLEAVSETHESMSWAPSTGGCLCGEEAGDHEPHARVFHKQNDLEQHRRSDDHG